MLPVFLRLPTDAAGFVERVIVAPAFSIAGLSVMFSLTSAIVAEMAFELAVGDPASAERAY